MMLRPQDTATRDTKCLSGMWDFAFDAEDRGQTEQWFTRPLPTCTEMAVPASYQDLSTDPAARDHVGPVWYQREVRIPRGWTDDRVVVHFESATHAATVWVNDVEVVRHVGGYLRGLSSTLPRARSRSTGTTSSITPASTATCGCVAAPRPTLRTSPSPLTLTEMTESSPGRFFCTMLNL